MKGILTHHQEFSGFEQPLRQAKYRLLQNLLVQKGYQSDRFSILEPSCDGSRIEYECRKSKLVDFYIDSINAGIDLNDYFDIRDCGLSPNTNLEFIDPLTEALRALNITLEGTITPIGTTGNRTINAPAGTVNIAAGQSSVVVTNNLVTANSLVFTVIRTADASLNYIDNVVPGAGSFTITGNANATGTVSVGFLVINVA